MVDATEALQTHWVGRGDSGSWRHCFIKPFHSRVASRERYIDTHKIAHFNTLGVTFVMVKCWRRSIIGPYRRPQDFVQWGGLKDGIPPAGSRAQGSQTGALLTEVLTTFSQNDPYTLRLLRFWTKFAAKKQLLNISRAGCKWSPSLLIPAGAHGPISFKNVSKVRWWPWNAPSGDALQMLLLLLLLTLMKTSKLWPRDCKTTQKKQSTKVKKMCDKSTWRLSQPQASATNEL